MEVVKSVYHFVTHPSTFSIVCLGLSLFLLFVSLTLAWYVNKNPHQYRGLCDRLIAVTLPLGVLALYVGAWSLPPIVAISAVVFYLIVFFGLGKAPSPFSGKG